ncbi:hypothetical protein TRFO_00886 [Tritrichomonas foetus]|uniref:Uncharacterized protein n=1 Tax=Tritrichomonas foetus TaxID=1144522 RepID=A0A1J4L6I9_9EUKA|nr:hypothetical protein TRFO_00886 [Tritrichomonas foetus]|eukprot:OHT17620.1 hypothetical protein TRFO_00886 [Tritrichomonas foetus]
MSPMSSPTKTIKPVPPAPPSTRAPEEDQEEMNEEEAIIEVDNENQAEIPVENLEIAQEENQEEIVQEDEFQDSNELVIDERLEQEINKDLKQANLEEEEQGIEDLLENNDGNNSDKEVEELLKLAGDDDFDDQQIEDLIKSDNE